MNSGLIGKIEKAHRYAKEPERIQVQSLQAHFNGDNDSYDVSLSDGEWRCRCHTYETFGDCQHVMAIQILLHDMLSEQAQGSAAVVSAR